MARRACDGDGLLDAFRAAVANLEAHVDEINGLNVYPVPDGDTGSNMYATVKAALDEAEAVAGQPADRIAAAISFGSLMGARGNSGVITSQIFRGMAEGLGGKRRFNGLDLAHACPKAPGRPTARSPSRSRARSSRSSASRRRPRWRPPSTTTTSNRCSGATLAGAERSVAKTPTLLAILREAGVVDAGGQGLYRLFQGALLHLIGQAPVTTGRRRAAAGPKPSTLVAHADEGFGYETMFLLQAVGHQPLDLDAIRDHLETIGESVLVAGDARALKVHVHNERPDQVIAFGLGLGSLSRISVENLDNQARDVRETRAAAFTASAGADDTGGHGGRRRRRRSRPRPTAPTHPPWRSWP